MLITSPGGVGLLKLKKRVNYSAGVGLLKRRVLALFLINFAKVYHFYIQKLLYPLQNCVICCIMLPQFYAATFSSQILMYSLKHPPPHPLNDQNLQSMKKLFCCCTLLNYKNESSTNVSKYYRLAISCKYKTFLWKEYFVVF